LGAQDSESVQDCLDRPGIEINVHVDRLGQARERQGRQREPNSPVVGASHDEGQRALSGIAFQPHCKLLGRGHELAGERPSLFPLRLCSALVASGTASK
jgi:hypothetical protein